MKRRGNRETSIETKSASNVKRGFFHFFVRSSTRVKKKKEIKVKKREREKGKRRFLTIVIYEHFRGVDELARDTQYSGLVMRAAASLSTSRKSSPS